MTILASCGHPVCDEELLNNVFFCRDDSGQIYSVLLCGDCAKRFKEIPEVNHGKFLTEITEACDTYLKDDSFYQ